MAIESMLTKYWTKISLCIELRMYIKIVQEKVLTKIIAWELKKIEDHLAPEASREHQPDLYLPPVITIW